MDKKENLEEVTHIVISALNKAFKVHESLGVTGEEEVQKNQFGDTALRVDIEIEKAILDFLKEIKFPIRVLSEEHGITEVGASQYLGILDGLDGSGVYKKERGRGRYGTMFAIFSTINPSYKDYIATGIMEHSTGKLFIASKDGGAFVIEKDSMTAIKSSGKKLFNENVQICIDEYFEINKQVFSEKLKGFHTYYGGSSCVYYADVASGAADFALECTRKGNLEIAVAYGLEREAGAVMIDMQGNDLGDKKYLEFGQKEQLPVITAATYELANQLLDYLQK